MTEYGNERFMWTLKAKTIYWKTQFIIQVLWPESRVQCLDRHMWQHCGVRVCDVCTELKWYQETKSNSENMWTNAPPLIMFSQNMRTSSGISGRKHYMMHWKVFYMYIIHICATQSALQMWKLLVTGGSFPSDFKRTDNLFAVTGACVFASKNSFIRRTCKSVA